MSNDFLQVRKTRFDRVMGKLEGIKTVSKVRVEDNDTLALVYTPGVAASCLEIKKDKSRSFDLTNRGNSVCVVAFEYEKALERAIFLKNTLNIDAYPICIKEKSPAKIKFVVDNIEPNFCGIDLTQVAEEVSGTEFNVEIPILRSAVSSIKDFFHPVSKKLMLKDFSALNGETGERSVELRRLAGGVIETELTEDRHTKPVGIISDGSAVLGLGNIGAESALPVMEGKAVLLESLSGVSAMPLCVKTQNSQEIIELVLLIEESFSAVNLEDISAPRCFEIEQTLIENSKIAIFHDDQHGTAIVVLAGILNALTLLNKHLESVKIVISGAGAAATSVARLLMKAGAKNILMSDIDGAVYESREGNSKSLDEIGRLTNPEKVKGTLSNIILDADVFIGLSAGNLLTKEMINLMAEDPIIFALANPTPEIDPKLARETQAKIIATGRSDFPNQINNSLAFPGIFKGVIEHNIRKITDEMKVNAAISIASLVEDEDLNFDNIIPNALDKNVPIAVAQSVVE